MSQELSKAEIIIDPNDPNKAWITEEMIQHQTEAVKNFLKFMRYDPVFEEPTTFTISFLEPSNARDLENFFKIYRDTFDLPKWIQIKVD